MNIETHAQVSIQKACKAMILVKKNPPDSGGFFGSWSIYDRLEMGVFIPAVYFPPVRNPDWSMVRSESSMDSVSQIIVKSIPASLT